MCFPLPSRSHCGGTTRDVPLELPVPNSLSPKISKSRSPYAARSNRPYPVDATNRDLNGSPRMMSRRRRACHRSRRLCRSCYRQRSRSDPWVEICVLGMGMRRSDGVFPSFSVVVGPGPSSCPFFYKKKLAEPPFGYLRIGRSPVHSMIPIFVGSNNDANP
ncbi:hypothetical protein E2542_SST04166 [Spatholobus suberectus]|nr:hypothetical protein E2542_SST04166 [Spatholobus suberectus]